MAAIPKELLQFKADRQYFQQHYDELLSQYPEQWVAIYRQQLVGAATDFDVLLAQLKAAGVPEALAFIERLTVNDDVLILPS